MKKKYIVAVSGGVDSVVLLDMLSRQSGVDLVVAHFDHGIRPNSADDAEFVKALSAKYNLPFVSKREELGANASEEKARRHRYAFLRQVASENRGLIATAHHADDVVETVAINLVRSTGWRGLAVLDSLDLYRPLIYKTKQELIDYALKNNLEWFEDYTNVDPKYLRNRLRAKLASYPKTKQKAILKLRQKQLLLKKEIEETVRQLVSIGEEHYSRHFFTMIDEQSAIECLRAITEARLTRPQMRKSLMAIKTAKPGSKYHAGAHVELQFSSRFFKVKMIK